MSVQRWVLVPRDQRLPARIFNALEAAMRALAWCPGRIVQGFDEDAQAARRRA